MPGRSCRILSIAPYRILPATSGGQLAILTMHDALGRLCQDHMVSTINTGSDSACSFHMHKIFPQSWSRYVPFHGLGVALGIARRYDATHVFCEHPYMAPLAIGLSRRLRVPWVLRSHNIETDRFRGLGKWWWPIFRLWEKWSMRAAHANFFITPQDCDRAISLYGLDPQRCFVAPYGLALNEAPNGNRAAKELLSASLGLDPNVPWLYFLGAHSYAPNAEAVAAIVREIQPRLSKAGINCELVIAGRGLPQPLQDEISQSEGAVRYVGFVQDIDTFIKACDVMLNPLLSGGGIKTKAIEALAYNKIVVSTENGMAGIMPDVCGDNLIVAPDGDWESFISGIEMALSRQPAIPAAFYQNYNSEAIAHGVINTLAGLRYAL